VVEEQQLNNTCVAAATTDQSPTAKIFMLLRGCIRLTLSMVHTSIVCMSHITHRTGCKERLQVCHICISKCKYATHKHLQALRAAGTLPTVATAKRLLVASSNYGRPLACLEIWPYPLRRRF
jgi:hypothetical protein